MTAFSHDDLPPELGDTERHLLLETARRLEDERPTPRPNYRGELRRRVTGPYRPARVQRLRRFALGMLATGAVLLAVAATGLADVGPLAPGDIAQQTVALIP